MLTWKRLNSPLALKVIGAVALVLSNLLTAYISRPAVDPARDPQSEEAAKDSQFVRKFADVCIKKCKCDFSKHMDAASVTALNQLLMLEGEPASRRAPSMKVIEKAGRRIRKTTGGEGPQEP